MESDVYFIRVESPDTQERLAGLKKLLHKLEPDLKYGKDEFVPVKLTIGDSTCVYHLNPRLVKTVVTQVKKKGAKPFLFDTCVIYKGARQNAVDHLNLAQSKGFTHGRTGAPFIIADGLFGQDGREFKIGAGQINKIKVPSFVGMLENLLVLTHVTGHIVAHYAGAIKNVAMGMSCRATKQIQHSSLRPSVIANKCHACGCCMAICPAQAISFVKDKAFIDQKYCLGCGECICACKFDCIYINWHEDPHIFSKRMAEVANFIIPKFKNKFFLNFAFDITKECDCISTKDEKMAAQNLGILASSDIVSLDKATADLISAGGKGEFFRRKRGIYAGMLEHAQKIGLGNLDYNLIEL